MNSQRAKEIVDSPENITVTYHDEPIYIQNVDETNDTARISALNNPEIELDVPIRMLKEDSNTN